MSEASKPITMKANMQNLLATQPSERESVEASNASAGDQRKPASSMAANMRRILKQQQPTAKE